MELNPLVTRPGNIEQQHRSYGIYQELSDSSIGFASEVTVSFFQAENTDTDKIPKMVLRFDSSVVSVIHQMQSCHLHKNLFTGCPAISDDGKQVIGILPFGIGVKFL